MGRIGLSEHDAADTTTSGSDAVLDCVQELETPERCRTWAQTLTCPPRTHSIGVMMGMLVTIGWAAIFSCHLALWILPV